MRPLIVIAGLTASGKTDLALELAQKLNTEIVSADSMQIYKYMDIGTAKIDLETRKKIKHYMIDEVAPDKNFSVADYQKLAKKYLNEIYIKRKIPVLCGGTGFYIRSILYDTDFMCNMCDQKDFSIREGLYKLSDEQLYNKLLEIDPESADLIHKNNKKRIIRAIEFFYQTGQKISQHNKIQKQNKIKYDTLFIVLNLPREIIYKKIDERVDKMIELGLETEVRKLLSMGYKKNSNSMQAIGYKEIVMYLDNKITRAEAIDLIKKNTRHYAKRQLTWFKYQGENITWIDKNNFEDNKELCDYVFDLCQKKFDIK